MSPRLARAALLPSLALLPLAACPPPQQRPPLAERFEAPRAWKLLEAQVALGPRPAGSEALERCRVLIEQELRAAGLKPVRERFQADTPAGEIEFQNVYADLAAPAPDAKQVILGSHFDTKRMPQRFVGANDAGSSTAVLLELARVLAAAGPRPVAYRFLFLDGEESLRPDWVDPDNTYGSRHHARMLKESGAVKNVAAFVLLDMVGDKDLRLTRDVYSDRWLTDLFFGAARKAGLGRHVDGPPIEIRDDHLSFLAVGIPSVDLIDFDFGPGNSWWHTEKDDLSACSQESLHVIGRIVLLGLESLETRLTQPR